MNKGCKAVFSYIASMIPAYQTARLKQARQKASHFLELGGISKLVGHLCSLILILEIAVSQEIIVNGLYLITGCETTAPVPTR